MLQADPAFRPLRRRDGYLPIEDPSLIGEGAISALVGVDGGLPRTGAPNCHSKPPSRGHPW